MKFVYSTRVMREIFTVGLLGLLGLWPFVAARCYAIDSDIVTMTY